MREIKFRAWDKKYNFMIAPDDIRHSNYEVITGLGEVMEFSESHGYAGTSIDWEDISDERILMQYTGLKDKNGKEIYEGDITINCDGKFGVIEFYSGKFINSLKFKNGSCWPEDAGYSLRYEVIGTIYENPKLLEGNTP